MQQKTIYDLRTAARQLANVEFDDVVTDTEVDNRCAEGLLSLDDILTSSNEHYRVKETTFTLTNAGANDGQNVYALPTDFYKEISLDRINQGANRNETITRFTTLERNMVKNRRFTILGDTLEVNPAQIAGGDYIFRYLTIPPQLLAPIALAVSVSSPADHVTAGRAVSVTNADLVDGGLNEWVFLNGAFTANDVGSYIYTTGATNAVNNGVHKITQVLNSTTIATDGLVTNETLSTLMTMHVTAGPLETRALITMKNGRLDASYEGLDVIISGADFIFNNGTFVIDEVIGPQQFYVATGSQMLTETMDSAWTVSFQQPDTIYILPKIYCPWFEYIQAYAARTILEKREQNTTSVDDTMNMLTQRIKSLSAIRTEDGGQVPMADNNFAGWFDGDWLGFSG